MTEDNPTSDPLVGNLLNHLEIIRNWLNEAPIDEIEAVEAAIKQNAPFNEIDEAIKLVWKIYGKPSTKSGSSITRQRT